MLSTFALRSFRRWKSLYYFSAFAILLLLLYLSNKRFHDKSDYSHKRHSGNSPNLADGKIFKILNDTLIVSPLRRSPMPSVSELSDGIPDEENAAKEMDVGGKDNPKNSYDYDNAAHEQNSGEADYEHSYKLLTEHKFPKGDGTKERAEPINIHEKENYDEDFHQLHEFPEPILSRSDDVIVKEKDHSLTNQIDNSKSNLEIQKPEKKEVPDEESFHQLPEHQKELPEDEAKNNWRNLSSLEISSMSRLGRTLFLNEKQGQEQNRRFKIHFWKYIGFVRNRLLKHYGPEEVDPFEDCSVSNCQMTYEDDEILSADAVIFHLHRISGPPSNVSRRPDQLWIWMSDESPYNVFMVARDHNLEHYNGYFNWSMTYRMDSDVPVPYGRTVLLPKDKYLDNVDDMFSKKNKGIAVLGSNCGGRNKRYEYIRELNKFIPVDIYGSCGPLKCPGHFNLDCTAINDYKFYLAFENSNCDDYVTEKVWWNAFHKGAVPIVMGASKSNYEKLLPPGSFIYAEDFDSPLHLAQHLRYLLGDAAAYNQYHQWRRKFKVLNEHGYFNSPIYHLCRVCEALNYNDRSFSKTSDIQKFYDPQLHCHPALWTQT